MTACKTRDRRIIFNEDPKKHYGRLKPIVDHAAAAMADLGITAGEVLPARDNSQMILYLNQGRVDWVSDTGVGIAEKDLGAVMAPFGQVGSTLGRRYPGTGLGLPLVKMMSELHGAEVDLGSQTGIGATIIVRFPKDRVVRRNEGRPEVPVRAT